MTKFGRSLKQLQGFFLNILDSAMSIDTFKRFDRIIAIFIHLQSKRVVKAQELADRFEVSLRTVYRDIRTLESCGVPICSEAGVGYTLMDGYRLPPVMFTKEEAGSFVAAEKLMEKFTDKSLGAYFASAMFKVKSVLRGSEKDWISMLESQVMINPAQPLFNEKIPNALELLFESIVDKKQVVLRYQSIQAEKSSERLIEPVGIFHENNFWYVWAYCHLRKDYRQFRTDRIHAITKTKEAFTLAHGTIDEHRKQEQEQSCERVLVRILVEKRTARHLKNDKKYYGFISEKVVGDNVEMTFLTIDAEHSFPRWFLMFGQYATILEPESLKEQVRKLLKETELKLNS
ncbi:transcriptional regulator [Marivirga lumbricoides]|uniref:Transcriptional regulator n=1 Tax=Marivirga lumbricoides TaxID=1046115 RepID=A0ABQ1M898_9BACT|nr:transcriptional regulator [Marivirga lumbricoides]